MYNKFPDSIFTAHKRFEKNNEILLQNIKYDDFLPVYEFLSGTKEENNEHDKIKCMIEYKELFDYFGIIDESIKLIISYDKIQFDRYKQKMNELNNFLSGKTKILLVKKYDEYIIYKNIIKNQKHIIPIQFIKSSNDGTKNLLSVTNTIFLSIYDGVPVYISGNWINDIEINCTDCYNINLNSLTTNGEINIYSLRLESLIKFINDELGGTRDYDMTSIDEDDSINEIDESTDEDDAGNDDNKDDSINVDDTVNNEDAIDGVENNIKDIEDVEDVQAVNNDDIYKRKCRIYISKNLLKYGIINGNDEYLFLEFMMEKYMWVIDRKYNDQYMHDTNDNLVTLDYNKLKKNINKYNPIKINKLKDMIQCLKKNKLLDQINLLDGNKKVLYKDYEGGAFDCNEASYYIYTCNMYCGFFNLS